MLTCFKCSKEIIVKDSFTTGYGVDKQRNKICYACCAEDDKKYMREHDKIMLYLVYEGNRQIGIKNAKITNWPGSLVIPVNYVRIGNHNIARNRCDVRFTFEGTKWYGVQYGDNTSIVHCRKYKA